MNARLWIPLLILPVAACATTTGPPVSSEEEAAAMEELLERGRVFWLEQVAAIWDMGYRVIAAIPPQEADNDEPFIGLLTLDALPEEARPRALGAHSGIVIAHVIAGGAAEAAGLRRGDAIVRLNDRPVRKGGQVHETVSKLARDAKRPVAVRLRIRAPDATEREVVVEPDVPKRFVPFAVLPDEGVNAGTNGTWIGVTRGMIRFAKRDDELAVVIGHELAHITKNHLGERLGRGLGWAFLGALVSALAGVDVTDFTRIATAIVESKFSRDQEREADYFGLQYAHAAGYDVAAGVAIWERFAIELPLSMTKSLFASHPTSAERMVRARKYAELVASGEAAPTGVTVPPDSAAAPPDSAGAVPPGPARRP